MIRVCMNIIYNLVSGIFLIEPGAKYNRVRNTILSFRIKINTLGNSSEGGKKRDLKNYVKIEEKTRKLGYAFDYFPKQIIAENFDAVFIVLQIALPGNTLTLKKLFEPISKTSRSYTKLSKSVPSQTSQKKIKKRERQNTKLQRTKVSRHFIRETCLIENKK